SQQLGPRQDATSLGASVSPTVLLVAAVRDLFCLLVSVPLHRGLGQNSRFSKLEKADILEMTVRFLQELPASPYSPEVPPPRDSYQEGYSACLARLTRVLPACGVLEPTVSARLLEHLRRRASINGHRVVLPSSGVWKPLPRHSPLHQARVDFFFF
uniref:Orange domain-containing protein n=1 Tax=Spermophilus dauricus TaxID=99837 RepID=A0A8C9QKD4_SPEDA